MPNNYVANAEPADYEVEQGPAEQMPALNAPAIQTTQVGWYPAQIRPELLYGADVPQQNTGPGVGGGIGFPQANMQAAAPAPTPTAQPSLTGSTDDYYGIGTVKFGCRRIEYLTDAELADLRFKMYSNILTRDMTEDQFRVAVYNFEKYVLDGQVDG